MRSFDKDQIRQIFMWLIIISLFMVALFNTIHMQAAILGYWVWVIIGLKAPQKFRDAITTNNDSLKEEDKLQNQPTWLVMLIFSIMTILGALINVPLYNAFFISDQEPFRAIISLAFIDIVLLLLLVWGSKTAKEKRKNDQL